MKRLILPTILILILTLTACSSLTSSTPTPLPTVALGPVSTNGSSTPVITAAAVVVPLREARLSIPAVGRVQSVDVKVGDKVKAGQALVHLDTTLLEARVREAEANLTVAQIQVQYLKRVGTDERFMQSAEADVERAQALLDSAKATLEAQAALVAPFDGTVITIDTAPGETLMPGYAAIVLGDLSKYQIKTTDLSERDVTRVRVGQSVIIYINALERLAYEGKVVDIALLSSTLGGDVVYTVTIEFIKQPTILRWGMSADVEIQAE